MNFELQKPELGALRQGNTGVEGVWQFDSGQPGRNVLITALIHGNELCGAWALKALLKANIRPALGRLTLVFANLEAFDTFDAANHDASRFVDEDMNRVWSDTKLTRPISQETRRAAALLPFIQQADWLLDLHSMHELGAPLLLTGLLPRNMALARNLGTPEHIVVDAGHKDGVRLRDYGRFGAVDAPDTCALLIECGFHGDVISSLIALGMVARFLRAANCVPADDLPVNWLQPLPTQQKAVRATHSVVARSQALRFTQDWQDLQDIPTKGTIIAHDGDITFTTPYDHCILIMPSLRQLRAGTTVVRLGQKIP
jgi:hypothetical protein